MATKLFANLGRGGTDGQTATNALLSGGDDNPLIIGGSSGWTFEADNISPEGPVDGHGFRRTATEAVSYLRAEWTAAGDWEGIRAWFYVPGAPAAHFDFLRLTGAGDTPNLANLYLRTTGRVRMYEGSSSISASESPVLSAGWYCFVAQANHATQQGRYRIYDSSLTQVHEWTGAVAHSEVVQGARVGETAAAAHGFSTIDIGSRVAWGSTDGDWIPAGVNPSTAVAPDITGVEPGATFQLEALSGSGTWEQVPVAGHPTVPLTVNGMTATGVAPYTLDGVTLQFTYGGSVQQVEVLRATRRVYLGGVFYPVKRRFGGG